MTGLVFTDIEQYDILRQGDIVAVRSNIKGAPGAGTLNMAWRRGWSWCMLLSDVSHQFLTSTVWEVMTQSGDTQYVIVQWIERVLLPGPLSPLNVADTAPDVTHGL